MFHDCGVDYEEYGRRRAFEFSAPLFLFLTRKYFTILFKFTYWRGDVCPPMSRRCRHRLCPDWLTNSGLNRLHAIRGYEDEKALVSSVDVAKSFNFIFPPF